MKDKENEKLLSFIVPVYNVEKYLQECLDSILVQMTDECEIILVNDGSSDASGEICKSYKEKNSNIYVINKENGGLSSARNAGLPIAKGKYITFIDSDDKISPNSLGSIIEWIKSEDADLCFLQAIKFYSNGMQKDLGENIERNEIYGKTQIEVIRHLASRPKYPGSAWAKLYRRDFLIENNIHFPYDRRYSEDLGFILDGILLAKKFDSLEIPFYQYRQNREGSITNKVSMKTFNDLLLFVSESVEKLNHQTWNNQIRASGLSFVAYEYMVLLYLYSKIPSKEKQEAKKKLKEYMWTLKYSASKKGRIINILCNILGIDGVTFLLNQYKRIIK